MTERCRPMDDRAAVISRFPEHGFLARRLPASNAGFRTLCEDHALAASAVGRWPSDLGGSEHCRLLVEELERAKFSNSSREDIRIRSGNVPAMDHPCNL